jgi:sulfotransferase family protein
MDREINVVIIVGRGKSGSTLLGHLLGQDKNILNVGELSQYRNFHLTMDLEKRVCADGIRLEKHPFWRGVMKSLVDQGLDEFVDLKTTQKQDIVRNYKGLFIALQTESQKQVIIISVKNWQRVCGIIRYLPYNIKILHLVRDPRAYGYSCIKKNKKAGPYVNEYKKVLAWNFYNLIIARRSLFFRKKYLRITYENLVTNTDNVLKSIYKALDINLDRDGTNKVGPQPAFSGNANFMASDKDLKIRLDYRNKLSITQWLAFTILSFPSNLFFGYSLTRKIPKKWVAQ